MLPGIGIGLALGLGPTVGASGAADVPDLLLESGDHLLLESGDKLLLE